MGQDELSIGVLCPTGRDARLVADVLSSSEMSVRVCGSWEDLKNVLEAGTGAVLLTQEVLTTALGSELAEWQAQQPNWSDLPIFVLVNKGDGVASRSRLLDVLPTATVLERPLHRESLVRAVQVALRARARQYELRDFLKEREALLDALESANAAKDEFLGLVSHELRTPVSLIQGGAKLLAAKGEILSPDDRSELLVDMSSAAERLTSTVENLLHLARADNGDLREPLHLSRVITRAVHQFCDSHPRRRVVLDPGPPMPSVICNESLFLHVIENLLSNAHKYSPGDAQIEVEVQRDGNWACVSVKDSGPGVKAEELNTIFQRFYRSAATANVASGLGLGLTVCRRLIESQGGTIWAERRENGGLAISFRLELVEEEPVGDGPYV